jgi:2-polyprenyl-3-methyl-5-hydroxy-6-metoxy-1,4-benzoquinol methylase
MNVHFIERTCCPACGSSQLRQLASLSYNHPTFAKAIYDHYSIRGDFNPSLLNDAEYNLQECLNCSLVFQKFVPDDYLLKQIYTVWIDSSKEMFSSRKVKRRNVGIYFQDVKFLIRYFDTNHFKSFDFGMGRGHWAVIAAACGVDSYGYEVDDLLMEEVEKRGVKTIKKDDFVKYDNYFDYIHTEQVFEHLPYPEQELARLAKMLKPNGIILLSVPFGRYAKRAVLKAKANGYLENSLLGVVAPLQHLNAFPHKALVKMAEKNGFKLMIPNFFDWVKTREIVYPESAFKTYLRCLAAPFIYKIGSRLYFQKVN